MARKNADPTRVKALLAVVRDGAAPAEGDAAALAFLSGEAEIDSLSSDEGLAAVATAVELGRADLVGSAQAARDKLVRKAARVAAHRLRSAGLEVEAAKTGTTWSIGKEERVAQPPLALIGMPEEDGYIPFLLASFGDEGACVSAGVAGPGQGFRDDDHAHTSRSQGRKIIDDARRDHRLHPVAFHEAVALLEGAFDAAGGKQPGGWSHLLSHLDEGARNAAKVLDPLRELSQTLDVDALHQVDGIVDGRWAVMLQGGVDPMSGPLEQVLEVMQSDAYPDADARRKRVEEIVDEAADGVLDGPGREGWAWALDVVAFLANRAGDTDASKAARATALALREGRAGRDIPWAREWTSRQLSFITDMAMKMGQGEPVEELG